jgi:hypothetical protein
MFEVAHHGTITTCGWIEILILRKMWLSTFAPPNLEMKK